MFFVRPALSCNTMRSVFMHPPADARAATVEQHRGAFTCRRNLRVGGVEMMATDASEIMIQTNPSPVPDNSFTTMSLKMTRKNQLSPWKLRLIYLQCCEYQRHAEHCYISRLSVSSTRRQFSQWRKKRFFIHGCYISQVSSIHLKIHAD